LATHLAHLRLSHLWNSFGPALNHIVASSARHQIHHNKAQRPWDQHFGEVFAFWDWLFGTLYMPSAKPGTLEFGIADATELEHPTLMAASINSFRNAGRPPIQKFLGHFSASRQALIREIGPQSTRIRILLPPTRKDHTVR